MLNSTFRRGTAPVCSGCRSLFSGVPRRGGSETSTDDGVGWSENGSCTSARDAIVTSTNNTARAAQELINSSSHRNGRVNLVKSDFYHQQKIALMSEKKSTRLTARQLMYATKPSETKYLLSSAAFLHKELPIRIAHMVNRFQSLPYLVGLNPHVSSVHQLYVVSFRALTAVQPIVTESEEVAYSKLLRVLLDNHEDVVTTLAHGFRECREILPMKVVKQFLDSFVTSRLGIRMLAEHHLALRKNMDGHVGVISTDLSPRDIILSCGKYAQRQCDTRYGRSPKVNIVGDTTCTFPYFAMPLKYILDEILKNAMRATVDRHRRSKELPAVTATICSNDSDFTIRISDLGGGIAAESVQLIQEYMFTTSEDVSKSAQCDDDDGGSGFGMSALGDFVNSAQQSSAGPMSGFGFGLPTACAFAKYLGGFIGVQSMYGRGTDIYVHLKHFQSPHHTIYF
ncbi:branched-chain alpha-ketoacid dehydrogenase kinase-like [Sycon ciliatum]|uniref:branched-chain alpha-ketoacid dehydrogenase kinase-like n=1 Tax=Sycon ciliatum TaxID=27933 RepID=UPI0020A8F805|eukprot:scpid61397/ scgid11350/ [3-methyl-2-oxobutanoate dehydrogenase [lipoamide]] kinase, mitochondrial; Branched-chain alpha-ketoacid dehydrogenase kinase